MTPVIHNIPPHLVQLLNIMWECPSRERAQQFFAVLPKDTLRDMEYLLRVIQAGGDDVWDFTEATQVVDRIRSL